MTVCRCGHPRNAHEHYRRGTDCSVCRCPRYRRPRLFARHAWPITFLAGLARDLGRPARRT